MSTRSQAAAGGVFRQLRYDNLRAAVKKILRGFRREETTTGSLPFVRTGASPASFILLLFCCLIGSGSANAL